MSTVEILKELRLLTPIERAEVQAKLGEWSAETTRAAGTPSSELSELMSDPAFGIWRDRTDWPADSVEVSKILRRQMMGDRHVERHDG